MTSIDYLASLTYLMIFETRSHHIAQDGLGLSIQTRLASKLRFICLCHSLPSNLCFANVHTTIIFHWPSLYLFAMTPCSSLYYFYVIETCLYLNLYSVDKGNCDASSLSPYPLYSPFFSQNSSPAFMSHTHIHRDTNTQTLTHRYRHTYTHTSCKTCYSLHIA